MLMKSQIFGLTLAASFLAATPLLKAQDAPAPQQTTPAATTAPAGASADATLSNEKPTKKKRVAKEDRVQQTKDVKAAVKKDKKLDQLAGKDQTLPDKQLYDKALAQRKSGHYDVARLGPPDPAQHLP